MPIRMLEAKTTLAEIDLAGDARVDHPLQRAVDSRAADPLVLAPDQIDEIVGGEVPLLAEEHIDDEIAFARALAAGRAKALEEGGGQRIDLRSARR